jgi:hypothetical protein
MDVTVLARPLEQEIPTPWLIWMLDAIKHDEGLNNIEIFFNGRGLASSAESADLFLIRV